MIATFVRKCLNELQTFVILQPENALGLVLRLARAFASCILRAGCARLARSRPPQHHGRSK